MSRWNEKQLELYTYDHLDKLAEAIFPDVEEFVPGYKPPCRLLGSQTETSVGVIDALMLFENVLYIVEFKSVKATERSLGQLQRYRSVVGRISADSMISKYNLPTKLYHDITKDFLSNIELMLIAPDFSKEAMLGADICIQAEEEYGEFYYEMVADQSRQMGQDFHLEKIVSPYLHVLIDEHVERLKSREHQILSWSAKQTAGFNN